MNKALKVILQIVKYIVIVFWCFVVLFPIYIIAVTALKSNQEYNTSGILALPKQWDWMNFVHAFTGGGFGLAFFNSIFIILFSVVGNVILGTMVAYVLSRFNFPGKKLILLAYLVVVFIPSITTQVATFGVIKNLGLFDTRWALVLLYLSTDVVQIYIYMQFINRIPYSLDEAALLEGASYFRIYRSVIFPLMMPATATVIILKTIQIYNDLYLPYLYMPASNLPTVSTALMRFTGPYGAQWNMICSAVIIIAIPTIVLFIFLQRYIFSGIVEGSVK